MSYPGSILGWSGPSVAKTPTQLAAEAKAGAAVAQPMIAERRERAAERAESGLLPGILGGAQMAGQDIFETVGVGAIPNVIRGGQEILGGTVKGVTGVDLSPAAIAEQSLLQQAAGAGGGLLGTGFGGIFKGLGIDPKLLLIGGVVVGAVVVLVVLK